MKIVTGVGENAHVTSKEFRRVIESMAGQGSFIIKCGDNMATDLVSNNLLKIKSGAMIHHGNISSVDPYDEIEINNGTQGMKRIDLVVNRYTKNAETEIESNDWVVIQGIPAASNPEVPAYTVGNLQNGGLVDDCPFCQIIIDGINVTEVKELLTIMPSIPELNNEVAELNSNINNTKNDIYDTNWSLCGRGYEIEVHDGYAPQVRRIGKIVHMRGKIYSLGEITEHDSALFVPEGYRPSKNVMFINSSAGSYRYRVEVKTNGYVAINGFTNHELTNATSKKLTFFDLTCSWMID